MVVAIWSSHHSYLSYLRQDAAKIVTNSKSNLNKSLLKTMGYVTNSRFMFFLQPFFFSFFMGKEITRIHIEKNNLN